MLSGELDLEDLFIQAEVDQGSPPWKRMGDMTIPRYYPTVIQLNRNAAFGPVPPSSAIDGGSHMVAGGPPCLSNAGVANVGNEYWDFLKPLPLGTTNYYTGMIPSTPGDPDSSWGGRPNAPNWGNFGPPVGQFDTYDRSELVPNQKADPLFDSYPRMFQLSTGEILVCGDVDTDPTIVPPTNQPGTAWVIEPRYSTSIPKWLMHKGPTGGPVPAPGGQLWHDSLYDTAVVLHTMSLLDRVIMFGGARNDNGWKINDRVWEFSMEGVSSVAEGQWEEKATPTVSPGTCGVGDSFKRFYPSAVILPTGGIFIVGGTSTDDGLVGTPGNSTTAVRQAVIYDPGVNSLDGGTIYYQPEPNMPPGAQAPTARLYHHVAVLLRSGKVFIAGGKRSKSNGVIRQPPEHPDPRFSGEVYAPPYLDIDGMGRTRPVLLSSPSQLTFSENNESNTFFITVARDTGKSVDRVVLLRPAAVTHHWDNDQRYIELDFAVDSVIPDGNRAMVTLEVVCPNEHLGPPGYYMLFAIETDGSGAEGSRIPTVGKFVDIQ